MVTKKTIKNSNKKSNVASDKKSNIKTDNKNNNKNNMIDNNESSNASESDEKVKSGFSFKISQIIIAVVVLALIALLIYFLSSNSNDRTDPYAVYNGYEFERHPQLQNVWITTVNVDGLDQRFEFRYHPLDLEVFEYDTDINQYFFLTQRVDGDVSLSFSDEVLNMQSGYIGLAGYDLARILRTYHGLEVVIFAENLDDYDWITCGEADINNMVVEFRKGDARVESLSPFCAVLFFDDPEDSLRMSSLLIYQLMGIME